jgi:hypothetical protein
VRCVISEGIEPSTSHESGGRSPDELRDHWVAGSDSNRHSVTGTVFEDYPGTSVFRSRVSPPMWVLTAVSPSCDYPPLCLSYQGWPPHPAFCTPGRTRTYDEFRVKETS